MNENIKILNESTYMQNSFGKLIRTLRLVELTVVLLIIAFSVKKNEKSAGNFFYIDFV